MKTSKQIGLFWSLAIVVAFSTLGIQHASAQLNEKKVERKASGNYNGRLYGGTKVYNDPDPLHSYTGNPSDSAGSAKVPIGKKRPSSTSVDSTGQAASTAGKESKSKVARNGKKVKVASKDGVASRPGDSHGPMLNCTTNGVTKLKGKKWKLTASMAGSRMEGAGIAYYTTLAEGEN